MTAETGQPTPMRSTGTMCIDVGQILGRLCTAAGQKPLDRYFVACAAVQFWADLLDAHESDAAASASTTGRISEALRLATREADHAGQVLLGQRAVPAMADVPALACAPLFGDSRAVSLIKALRLPMPECCGYNLADIELIADDARQLIGRVGVDRPMLIVGVRTGGVYLAPLWKAVLTGFGVADAHWCTVRPQAGQAASVGQATTLQAWFGSRRTSVVVVVDDQPDTGVTMGRVAALLHSPGIDLWFASVGKLWRGPERFHAPSYSSLSVVCDRRNPRLWECLSANEHPRFIERLQEAPGLPAIPEDVRLQFRCPQGELRYGLGCAWLPWNDARVMSGRRPLVNPRKTPIAVCDSRGQALMHLRFIGEGVFGRAELQRVQEMDCTRPAWFIDGYAVTVDIGRSQSFREQFHESSPSTRADLLAQTANWLNVLAGQVTARAHNNSVVTALGPRWESVLAAMQARCGERPALSRQLGEFLAQPVPWLGQTGRAIRSSLRYACGDWHWQVDEQGRLHRFQLETNWGDVSFPELELGAFLVENRLARTDAHHLASLCGLVYSSVRESLSLAAVTIAEARLRSVRTLSERGRIALRRDFDELLATASVLAGFETSLAE
ncbi:hypothetical protein [Trinickia soli]|uniref:hypothetical protein n=1 Tax=Trinickia soli TaxID=380675 RepID=UPI003FA359B7